MTHCAIHGPRRASAGEPVRVDVVVRDAPTGTHLRIRLEQLAPSPRVHVDEWLALVHRSGTTSVSFMWRAPECQDGHDVAALLRASVWSTDLLGACTHEVELRPVRRRRRTSGVVPAGAAAAPMVRLGPDSSAHLVRRARSSR
jgi:hypothetical protein